MPAYVIVRARVTDPARYQEYMKLTPGTVANHGGKFIVRGGEVTTLEGPAETRRIVVIEFATLEKAKTWYHSEEYLAARKLRAGAAEAEFIAVDGVAYPTVATDLNETVCVQGHQIHFRTVNLSLSWQQIEARLLSIIKGDSAV